MTKCSTDLLELLACPVDRGPVDVLGDELKCREGHAFPIIEGVPVMLRSDITQTIDLAASSCRLACSWQKGLQNDPLFIETLGISEVEKAAVKADIGRAWSVDPIISHLVGATNGILYKDLIGKLDSIPIPGLRLPDGEGRRLLDVGCSWGRWSIAAAQKGYRPVGIDPSLGAVLAAKRLALRLGYDFEGVVGDARHLPFRESSFQTIFSYSVLQHFSEVDARRAWAEIARATETAGLVKLQMASATGIRSLQHILLRGMRAPSGFEVRYWTPWELLREFRKVFGNGRLEADCYFGLGLQPSDTALLTPPRRILVRASEILRRFSEVVRPAAFVADSVYLTANVFHGEAPAAAVE